VAYTYNINPTHGLVIIRNASSEWTGEDILESAGDIVGDDRFAPDYDWVYDLRFVHNTAISVVEMEQIVERFRLYREDGLVDPDSRSVIVGSQDDLHHTGLLYQKRSGRPDELFVTVETMEEARRWLGIDEPASEIGLVD
jgi:hypothetical protein